MQAKQFFALFLLVIISVDAITPEARLNAFIKNIQNQQVVGANSSPVIEQALNNIQKGLAALIEQNYIMFDSEATSASQIISDVSAGISVASAVASLLD